MSKSSKSCGYTGQMHIMNRGMNETKEIFNSARSKAQMNAGSGSQGKHVKKGSGGLVYPEAQCNCAPSSRGSKK